MSWKNKTADVWTFLYSKTSLLYIEHPDSSMLIGFYSFELSFFSNKYRDIQNILTFSIPAAEL